MRGFYRLFPDYRANELWIAGESYAGILCAPFSPSSPLPQAPPT